MPAVRCPNCSKRLEFRHQDAGRIGSCSLCGEKIELPEPEGSSGLWKWIAVGGAIAVVMFSTVIAVLLTVTGEDLEDVEDSPAPSAAPDAPRKPALDIPIDLQTADVEKREALSAVAYERTCAVARERSNKPVRFLPRSDSSWTPIAGKNQARITVKGGVQVDLGIDGNRWTPANLSGWWQFDGDNGIWTAQAVFLAVGDDVVYLVDNIGLQKAAEAIVCLSADCRQTRRFTYTGSINRSEGLRAPYRSGVKLTQRFTVFSKWWRYRVIPDSSLRPVTVEVLDLAGDVVQKTPTPVEFDRRFVVGQDGTFELRVTSRGQWKIIIEEPR